MGPRRSESGSSLSGMYVTLKVFQLVNQLKKRLKARTAAAGTNKPFNSAAQKSFEKDLFCGIEKCLSTGISGLDGKKSRASTEGIRKVKKYHDWKPGLLLPKTGADRHRKSVERLLQDGDDILAGHERAPLAKLAGDNDLFIGRRSDPSFRGLSWVQVAQSLAFVHDAIDTLRSIPFLGQGERLICSGDELGTNVNMDASFLANLEHILLRLRGCLIEALIDRTRELLNRNAWHSYWKRHGRLLWQGQGWPDGFVSEYPNSRRPLSTTWPWSIRPSLAVLWGVCWMFYPETPYSKMLGDGADSRLEATNVSVPVHRFFQNEEFASSFASWTPQGDDYLRFGQAETAQDGGQVPPFASASEPIQGRVRAAAVPTALHNNNTAVPRAPRQPHVTGAQFLPTPSTFDSGRHQHPPPRPLLLTQPQSSFCTSAGNQDLSSAQPGLHFSLNSPEPPAHPSHHHRRRRRRCYLNAPSSLASSSSTFASDSPSRTDPSDIINALQARWPHQALAGIATPTQAQAPAPARQRPFFQPECHSSWTPNHHPLSLSPSPSHAHSLQVSPPRPVASRRPRSSPTSALPPAQPKFPDSQKFGHLIGPRLTVQSPGGQVAAPRCDFLPHTYDESFSPPEALQGTLNLTTASYSDDSFGRQMQQLTSMGNNGIPAETASIHSLPSPVSVAGAGMNGHEKSASPHEEHRHQIPTAYPEPPPPPHAPSPGSSHDQSEELNHDSELYTPNRRGNTFKRADDPQRNGEGKMVCTYWNNPEHPECRTLTFDRRCEWSKHMDKHDRPYKCAHKGCEKLQGFTYSGGLLRHEREVHKMHGGTKKSLFCPHSDCKRSSGSGFTRKENLAEHIRRVHRTSSGSTDAGAAAAAAAAAAQAQQQINQDYHLTRIHESPDATDGEPRMDAPPAPVAVMDPSLNGDDSLKRKRMSMDLDGSEIDGLDSDGLRAEIKRLRRENEEKDERLRRLEATVAKLVGGPPMGTLS